VDDADVSALRGSDAADLPRAALGKRCLRCPVTSLVGQSLSVAEMRRTCCPSTINVNSLIGRREHPYRWFRNDGVPDVEVGRQNIQLPLMV
jgi:hypothetical protein